MQDDKRAKRIQELRTLGVSAARARRIVDGQEPVTHYRQKGEAVLCVGKRKLENYCFTEVQADVTCVRCLRALAKRQHGQEAPNA